MPATGDARVTGLRASVILGTAWAVALRWFIRLIGIANVAIVARILAPADFGLLAMATLVIGLIEMWLAFGVDSALIQNADADREDFDTAWTIRFLQGVVIAAVVVASAPLAQAYFREPRLGPLLWALSLGVLVSGLTNIGVVQFTKNLEFGKDFRYRAISKLISFAVGVGAALWMRNYWALAVGIVGGYIASCIVSYVVHPYRPRWSLKRWRKLWSFSQWMLLMNVLGYVAQKADEVLVGRYLSATQMGFYSVASDIGLMPSAELAAPVNRVLFPAFSRLQSEPGRLAAAYCNALAMVAAVTVPAGAGLALVAHQVVALLLGAKWGPAVPMLQILAVGGIVRSLASSGSYLLMSIGHPRLSASTATASLAIFGAGAAIALAEGGGASGIAWAKLASGVFATIMTAGYVVHFTAVRLRDLLRSIARPVLAAAAMSGALMAMPQLALPLAVGLAINIAVGAAVYALALGATWWLAGRPDGPERTIVEFLQARLARKRNR